MDELPLEWKSSLIVVLHEVPQRLVHRHDEGPKSLRLVRVLRARLPLRNRINPVVAAHLSGTWSERSQYVVLCSTEPGLSWRFAHEAPSSTGVSWRKRSGGEE